MDGRLVERARSGDSGAQEELVRRLAPRLFQLALRFGCDGETAEDLVAETLTRGMLKLGRLRESGAAAAWFFRILVNRWRDRLRKKVKAKRRVLSLDDLSCEPAAPESSAADVAAREGELRERVTRAVASLPARQRAVLALSIDAGLSVAEIADVLGATPERVKANLWHGRQRQRLLLGDLCGPEPLREES